MMKTVCPVRIRLAAAAARQVASSARVTTDGPLIEQLDSALAYSVAADSSAAVALAGRVPPPLALASIAVTT